MKKLILLLSVLGMLSCTHNTGLERTFQRAGENRAELEKVDPNAFFIIQEGVRVSSNFQRRLY